MDCAKSEGRVEFSPCLWDLYKFEMEINMNGKTARMLDRFSLLIDVPKREVKRRWNTQTPKEREEAREQIMRLLSKGSETVQQKRDDRDKVREDDRQRFLKLVQPRRRVKEDQERKARRKKMRAKNKRMRKALGVSRWQSLIKTVKGWFHGKN